MTTHLRSLLQIRRALSAPEEATGIDMSSAAFTNLATVLEEMFCDRANFEGDPEEVEAQVKPFLDWARRCAHALSFDQRLSARVEKTRGGWKNRLGADGIAPVHGRYTSWFVLHAVQLCGHLKNDQSMESVIKMALFLAFPREVAKQLNG